MHLWFCWYGWSKFTIHSKSRKPSTKTCWESHSGIPVGAVSIFLCRTGIRSWVCITLPCSNHHFSVCGWWILALAQTRRFTDQKRSQNEGNFHLHIVIIFYSEIQPMNSQKNRTGTPNFLEDSGSPPPRGIYLAVFEAPDHLRLERACRRCFWTVGAATLLCFPSVEKLFKYY